MRITWTVPLPGLSPVTLTFFYMPLLIWTALKLTWRVLVAACQGLGWATTHWIDRKRRLQPASITKRHQRHAGR